MELTKTKNYLTALVLGVLFLNIGVADAVQPKLIIVNFNLMTNFRKRFLIVILRRSILIVRLFCNPISMKCVKNTARKLMTN